MVTCVIVDELSNAEIIQQLKNCYALHFTLLKRCRSIFFPMNNDMSAESTFFPGENSGWAEKLYCLGLLLFAFTCTFSISASQTSLSLSLIGCLAMIWQKKFRIRISGLNKPFFFLIFSGVLSLFASDDLTRGLVGLKTYLIIMVFNLFFWPKMRKEFQYKLLYTFISSAVLVTLVNNWQIILGLTEARHTKGFFSICITFGECMGLAAIATLMAYAENTKGRKYDFLLLLAGAIISISLVQALTRGAWLGFAAGTFVITLRFPRRILPIILLMSLAAGFAVSQNDNLRSRLTGLNFKKTLETADKSLDGEFTNGALYSNMQRLYIWKRGFLISDSSLPFGVGLRNVKRHYNALASDVERERDLIWGHQHNNFMHKLAMTGFTGLIAFFYFVVSTIRFLLQVKPIDSDGQKLHHGGLAIFVGFLVFGLTEYCWGDEEVLMTTLFLTALMVNRTKTEQSDQDTVFS